MPLPLNIYNEAKEWIPKQQFKIVQLYIAENDGWKKVIAGNQPGVQKALARLEYIHAAPLEAGDYMLQTLSSYNTGALTRKWEFTKQKSKPATAPPRKKEEAGVITVYQTEEVMSPITNEQYLGVYEQLSDAKSENLRLAEKVKELEAKLSEKLALGDAAADAAKPDPIVEIFKGIGEGLKAFAPAIDKHFELKDRELNLREQALSAKKPFKPRPSQQQPQQAPPDPGNDQTGDYDDPNNVVQMNGAEPEVWEGRTYDELISELDTYNEDEFNQELDAMQQQNPALYRHVCGDFGINPDTGESIQA